MIDRRQPASPHPYEYLCVDGFLGTLLDARALLTAFESGLVDHLLANPTATVAELGGKLGFDERGLRLLLDLLSVNRVIELAPPEARVTPEFVAALRFRDLLEAKIEFAGLVAADVLERFTALLADPAAFMASARLFELFDYGRCFEASRENVERTRRWVRLTTILTRYESQVCMAHHDFGAHRRMLDVGGNSGELVLQACRRHPELRGTVFDLPVVCGIGEEHVRGEPESPRITFQRGDALRDPIPTGFDLISFKSMLHDWAERDAGTLIGRASEALEPGGTLMIFERGPIRIGPGRLPYAALPILLFHRFFRSPGFYRSRLEEAGLRDVRVADIDLDTPFHLITARKHGRARPSPVGA